jgi:predicted kinase
MTTGSEQTTLIVLRGNSGSGKSTVASAIRDAYGRGLAWVPQDLIRRVILREKDQPGGVNVGLIDHVARYTLDHGYHVVLDGVFYADRYEPMLARLGRDHLGVSRFYYLDVSLEETFRRHATRPQAAEFTTDDMRSWYRSRDLLTGICERVIPQVSTLQETVNVILAESQLLQAATTTTHDRRSQQPPPEPPNAALGMSEQARDPGAGIHGQTINRHYQDQNG